MENEEAKYKKLMILRMQNLDAHLREILTDC